MDIRRLEIMKLIDAGNINAAEQAIDTFLADFREDNYAGQSLRRIAKRHYETALRTEQSETAAEYFVRAIGVWDRIINQLPESFPSTPAACFFIGATYKMLDECEDAIPYFEYVLIEWPDYEHAWKADALLAECIARAQGAR
jgi:tetratricopeptide (TPR) repeat protein